MSQRQRKSQYWQDAPLPRGQMVLIPSMLEELIPTDHPVRMLDEILDRMDWSNWESQYHGSFGQPPIHPSVLCKVLLFAMIRRIRSSRQIEYALKHSIDFIWLSSGRRIDHVTLSNFRRAHSEQLRGVFKQLVQLAISLGVANLSELCIDGTRVLANANKYKTWTVAKIEKLLSELDSQLISALAELEDQDTINQELFGSDYPADKLPPALADMKTRREQLAGHLATLKEMEAARAKWGTDATKNPAQLPKTDPDSRILPNKEGGYAPNYTPMICAETQSGFVISADVMIGNVEHDQATTIIDTTESEYGVDVERVLVDAAYSTGKNLSEFENREIEFIAPLNEVKCSDNPAQRAELTAPVADSDIGRLPLNPQTKTFDKSSFIYDEQSDCYYCPAGKKLEYRGKDDKANSSTLTRTYSCDPEICATCSLVALCRKNPQSPRGKDIVDDVHEDARRRHRVRMKTVEAQAAYARRQHPGETPFACLKANFGIRRFLLRGIEGVKQEWLLGATAYNLKKLIGMWGQSRDPSNLHMATKGL